MRIDSSYRKYWWNQEPGPVLSIFTILVGIGVLVAWARWGW